MREKGPGGLTLISECTDAQSNKSLLQFASTVIPEESVKKMEDAYETKKMSNRSVSRISTKHSKY